MPVSRHYVCPRPGAAFTLVELLAVLVVIALLACVCLPALARVKTQTFITQCSGNLRQVTLSFLLYASDKNDQLPSASGGGSNWPWDLPDFDYQILKTYGAAQTNLYYCPSNPYQNSLWNWGGPAFHVTGYACTIPGIAAGYGGLLASNYNSTVTPQQTQNGANFAVPSASKRVLVADAEICAGLNYDPFQPMANYNFTSVAGGAVAFPDGRYHRASHLAGNFPMGGNQGMLDGHVEWRPFRSSPYTMVLRNNPQGFSCCFLW